MDDFSIKYFSTMLLENYMLLYCIDPIQSARSHEEDIRVVWLLLLMKQKFSYQFFVDHTALFPPNKVFSSTSIFVTEILIAFSSFIISAHLILAYNLDRGLVSGSVSICFNLRFRCSCFIIYF